MANSKYYYDPKTCQYKRFRFSSWKVVLYVAGVFVTAGFMLVVMIFVSDQITLTELEKAWRQENKALRKHKKILTAQLTDIETSLTELNKQDKFIQARLFDIEPDELNQAFNEKSEATQSILFSTEEDFGNYLNDVSSSTQQLRSQSIKINNFFSIQYKLKPEDAVTLQDVPTMRPIESLNELRLVSGFGIRINPFHKGKYKHTGMDFAAPRGTTVQATAPGKIKKARVSSLVAGYGNHIIIDHGNGFVTLYAHLDEVLVRNGEQVSKGEVIGTVGSSGGSMAPHLHYEITHRGEPVDPLIFMIEGLSSSEYNQLHAVSSQYNQSLD